MNGHRTTSWRFPPHEHAALEHLLLGDLRDMLEEQPDADATPWLLAVLDTLLDLLPDRFAHEENGGGYLSEVIDEFPTWEPEVFRLRKERLDLFHGLWQLRDHIRRNGHSVPLNDVDISELCTWIEWLERHDQEETDLLQTAVNLDVGGEG